MTITKENLIQHEFIGLEMKILDSSEPSLIGKNGVIMDETKNMITLKDEQGLKKVPKRGIKMSITTPKGEEVKVKGKELEARPEDRVKKLR